MNAILLLVGILALTGARGVNVNGGNGTEKPQVTQGYYNPRGNAKMKMNSRNIIDWKVRGATNHIEPRTYWLTMVDGQKTVMFKYDAGHSTSIELYVPEHYTIE